MGSVLKSSSRVGPHAAAMIRYVICAFCLVAALPGYAQTQTVPAGGLRADAKVKPPILIGLDAAMTGGAARSGEAIRRGLALALDEINAQGGVLGRKLKLVIRDNRGVTARGVDNIREFARTRNLIAVVGGMHTSIALAELDLIHKEGLIYLGPWAAGTRIVDSGHVPNYVFRVSVRDDYAAPFLVKAALDRGYARPGLLLLRTGWGRSNKSAMTAAMKNAGMRPAGIKWFNTSERDISAQIKELIEAGADVIILVANPLESLTILRNMAALPKSRRIPILSHWGITGTGLSKRDLAAIADVDLTVLQTFSFFSPPFPARARRFFSAYCKKFGGCQSPASVFSPVGTAHAYDLVHLLKRAMEKANSTNTVKVRHALERLGRYEGLVRVYDPPFTPTRHDALDRSDFRLTRYDARGALIPVGAAVSR